jgi:hypothetical protein
MLLILWLVDRDEVFGRHNVTSGLPTQFGMGPSIFIGEPENLPCFPQRLNCGEGQVHNLDKRLL